MMWPRAGSAVVPRENASPAMAGVLMTGKFESTLSAGSRTGMK
jgi:hypothetical protein